MATNSIPLDKVTTNNKRSFVIVSLVLILLVAVAFTPPIRKMWISDDHMTTGASVQTSKKEAARALKAASAAASAAEAVTKTASEASSREKELPGFPPGDEKSSSAVDPSQKPAPSTVIITESKQAATTPSHKAATQSARSTAGRKPQKGTITGKAPKQGSVASKTSPRPMSAQANTDSEMHCDPSAGCTLAWALGKTLWPESVQNELLHMVKDVRPSPYAISSNWKAWVVWGTTSPHFEPTAVVRGNDREASFRWTHVHENVQYNLVRVGCRTWAGSISTITQSPPHTEMNKFGTIPAAYCR